MTAVISEGEVEVQSCDGRREYSGTRTELYVEELGDKC
jgi:hypothetical protein